MQVLFQLGFIESFSAEGSQAGSISMLGCFQATIQVRANFIWNLGFLNKLYQ